MIDGMNSKPFSAKTIPLKNLSTSAFLNHRREILTERKRKKETQFALSESFDRVKWMRIKEIDQNFLFEN